ncbi:MAG: D-2-hydroxyacid dehydrogenase [Ruminiclostridium sp.]|nr:D-2-hydroxyacid dehydrogenase [Ruminiclostridium sp.]
MKIVILDSDTVSTGDLSFSGIARFGEVKRYGLTEPERIAERVRDAEIILCNKTFITREVMEKAPKLRYIGLFATGFNNIDLECAKERGIAVANVPAYSTEGVVQLTYAFILEHYCRLSDYRRHVDGGNWKKSATFSYFPFPIGSLAGKTMGIIGYGSIGKRSAQIANAFGMKVLVYTRTPKEDETVDFVDFDTLLRESDIVSVHCPLNAQSEKMMNAEAFGKMKKGALFINTSRGPIVDEYALRDALVSGKLMGAGLDVLCTEPMAEDCPLYGIENCIITPHVGWAGIETRRRLMEIVESNIGAFIEGREQNRVV